MNNDDIDEIKSRLDLVGLANRHTPLKKVGKVYKGRCPFPGHNDSDPSFTVWPELQGYRCFGCNRTGDVITLLEELEHLDKKAAIMTAREMAGLSSSPPVPPARNGAATSGKEPPTTIYTYQDEKGKLLYQVVRKDLPGGKKDFSQRRPDGVGRYIYSLGDVRRVLYRLPQLLEAGPKTPVFIVEGEKCVERLVEVGLVATCNVGGAGMGWREEYSETLAGRHVIIVPDNDEIGRKHAEAVLKSVYHKAKTARVLNLEGLGEHGDVYDWLGAGHDAEELVELARKAEALSPGSGPTPLRAGQGRSKAVATSAPELASKTFEPVRWVVPDILPEGHGILAGRPKIGKSWVSLQIGVAVACGGVALGAKPVQQGSVLYLALEDNERRLQSRLLKVLAGGPAPEKLSLTTTWPRADEGGVDAIEDWLRAHSDARLVVVDTLAKFRKPHAKNENLYEADYEALAGLTTLAHTYRVGILVIHHTRKGEGEDFVDDISGSTGLTAVADTIMTIRRRRGEAEAILNITGRDIIEDGELAMSFDKEFALWQLLGEAGAYAMSGERKEVVELLQLPEFSNGLGPAEIARELGKRSGSIRKLLRAMLEAGNVEQDGSGRYRAKIIVSGNTGNIGNTPQVTVTEKERKREGGVENLQGVTGVTYVTPVTGVTGVTANSHNNNGKGINYSEFCRLIGIASDFTVLTDLQSLVRDANTLTPGQKANLDQEFKQARIRLGLVV